MATSSFKSYLDDLEDTSCCRSASLLIPTINQDADSILRELRLQKWTLGSVLIRPWRKGRGKEISTHEHTDPWYYRCLPSEEELSLFVREYPSSTSSGQSTPPQQPLLREEFVKNHIESKSLLVPLTDDATAFILLVLFGRSMHSIPECHGSKNETIPPEQVQQRVILVQKWFSCNEIAIIHNCDDSQTVSLCKERDYFPVSSSYSLPVKNEEQPGEGFTFVDLFAGIGGFRIGLEALGGTCIGSCEIDPYARDTYRHNFLKQSGEMREFFVNDITRLEIPHHMCDVICGGFPCQSFSTLASFPSNDLENRKGAVSRGVQSLNVSSGRRGGLNTPHRGKLFFHLLRVLRKSKPKLFVFENVKGLMHLDNGSHYNKIIHLLEESGYHVTCGVVDCSWFLPQRRERIYFVGVRLDLFHDEKYKLLLQLHLNTGIRDRYKIYSNDLSNSNGMDKFERILHESDHGQKCSVLTSPIPPSRLGDILESSETVSSQHPYCFLTASQWEKVRNQGYLQFHSDGSGQLVTDDHSCAQTLVSSYRKSYLMHSQFLVPRDSLYLAEQKKRLVAEAQNKKRQTTRQDASWKELSYCKNLTLPRFFTPRECCRLQGFPEYFILPFVSGEKKRTNLERQFYRQIGNAASPPCVAAVIEYAVSLFLMSNSEHMAGGKSSVFDLILEASPNRTKVMSAIERNFQVS